MTRGKERKEKTFQFSGLTILFPLLLIATTAKHSLTSVEVQMSRFNPIHGKCAFPPGYS